MVTVLTIKQSPFQIEGNENYNDDVDKIQFCTLYIYIYKKKFGADAVFGFAQLLYADAIVATVVAAPVFFNIMPNRLWSVRKFKVFSSWSFLQLIVRFFTPTFSYSFKISVDCRRF